MSRARSIGLGAVFMLAPISLAGQDALGARMQELSTASRAGRHDRAVHLADSLASVLPGHPSIVLTRAVVLARAGRLDDARAAVLRLKQWDPRYARRALEDSALAPLRGILVADDITRLAAEAERPVARGQVWAVLEERDLVPEGTAYDPATRAVLVGSLNKYKVVAIDESGRITDRVPSGHHGLRSVVGIHVDSARGVLWVASNARFDDESDTTSSALYAFESATGAFRAKYAAPTGRGHFLNDLTTTPDGTVYVTDSQAGKVWILRPGRTVLESFTDGGMLFPNGITSSPDGRHLFVATGDHIRVFPLSGGGFWKLEVPDSVNVTGIDGLAFAGNALIAHHPLAYWRIARYPIDAAHRRITGRVVLEHMTPDGRTSTTGEVVGGDYVYIGNSQIDRMNTRTIDSAGMEPIRMYRVRR
jgi:sugar lactone lactonase YvrE